MKKHLLAAGLRRVGHGHMTVHSSFVSAATADAVSHHNAQVVRETSAATSDKDQAQQVGSSDALPLPKQTHE